jgi:uncharacterized membrane protein
MPDIMRARWTGSDIARITIAPIYVIAGLLHIAHPGPFVSVTPPGVPDPGLVILLTGVAELAGAIGLFIPRTRYLAGIMLALYAVCVYPANILQAVHDLGSGHGLGWTYHYPRLFAQPFVCWWALAAGRVVGSIRLGS